MQIQEQIKKITIESNNDWFLTHDFPNIALKDLQIKEELIKKKKIDYNYDFDERKCTCFEEIECKGCLIESKRTSKLKKLDISKQNNYNYEKNRYKKSKWIFHKESDNEISGFLLIKYNSQPNSYSYNLKYELYFACVRPKYRQKGILKKMVNSIPQEWNIWLEANSNDNINIENVWIKCGFSYYKTINGAKIYKKCNSK